tara:strand:- start:96 stop:353 length:258 start_codon:yes stop_codon:yes gene_type:complete
MGLEVLLLVGMLKLVHHDNHHKPEPSKYILEISTREAPKSTPIYSQKVDGINRNPRNYNPYKSPDLEFKFSIKPVNELVDQNTYK